MKKTLLLLVTGAMAMTAAAQQRQLMGFNNFTTGEDHKKVSISETNKNLMHNNLQPHGGAADRTTSVTMSRWYNYADYYAQYEALPAISGNTDAYFPFIWKDTLNEIVYTSGLAHNTMVSAGTLLQPWSDTSFNLCSIYGGQGLMKLKNTDAYTVDSVLITGFYGFNPAKTSVVDTLRLSFVMGPVSGTSDIVSGGLAAGGYYGAITFEDILYDSVDNMTGPSSATGHAFYTKDIYLDATEWGDTLSNGVWAKSIPVTFACTPGSLVGMSVSFISGDASFPTTLPGDTVFTGHIPGLYRYNTFRPFILYKSDGATPNPNAEYPDFDATNYNEGLYKNLPNYLHGWDNVYIPNWAWGVSAASPLQFPNFGFHITASVPTAHDTVCYVPYSNAGVNNVTVGNNSVIAYPNPAYSELNIAFNFTQAATISVTLTNMVGQVVATQNMGSVANGTAVFNTNNLADGMYIYTVTANGVRTTGHIAVSH